ncbi:bifunctional phosphopantothenoylcysteine decarboxylase/phosphopantothenate--cysteine ligase CoaBC [Idiomarina baltica]|jgi:phosphopantothenoylcysteine decarboxylase/phosphopantothenate--cysteine ligase|uniref:Coenzyme A biosynthesis bifunctional protein CoaBC n=1 Tax=Idiomarina baltica OS145 TaxID=314276 RepID=A0ABM9WQ67_9GAMM|nr:bifunctional phosphopantothenoylcysteine decarboxylase/phosphopantothenate--cysteine ligase CoaBC [Idiomarina baltica]EAQ33161.1 Phosphopantothenoylcysteine synthetase/decarboxylase [Idiomarina baltica OS145]MBL73763.1 bifunctional phosphopantothenoylcysteine decarboxylase/phosphopantothenate--cysteine ligase CoaBC [Idiomarinaceae bacterium]MBR38108.1 bifunctional phosphopantothenoylcysteine decarboxylase/phosphopantothenate--cysteine ligase CoaBC [Idiomarina sp.]HAE90288.1 bifunctional phos|tara:strand:+ start:365 stop:1582 length:1218 start_codon:yes stop_codon:yes gene_type:complete
MSALAGQHILIGITGGIAAYKIPELIRRLKDEGAQVRVILTKGGEAFVTPMTLQAVSGEEVHSELLDTQAEAGMGHIQLAKWADIVMIAPASANTLAKLAHGFADDLLSTVCLATAAPLLLAPAMNQQMWQHPAVKANMQRLSEQGVKAIGPESGSQACGDVGAGRMSEPHQIKTFIIEQLQDSVSKPLAGVRLTITAGPTREAIDPVRYISNHSSGKMGFALAQSAAKLGAEVTLIAGPVDLQTPTGVKRLDVESAQEMLEAALANPSDIFIGCAAVADYRVANIAEHKIKKNAQSGAPQLELIENPDILKTIAEQNPAPMCVGFAAETRDVETYAIDKLKRKKLALIIANDVSNSDIGFNSDNNAAVVLSADERVVFEQQSKTSLAHQLAHYIANHFHQNFRR